MPPKKSASSSTQRPATPNSTTATVKHVTTARTPPTTVSSFTSTSTSAAPSQTLLNPSAITKSLWSAYASTTTARTKLIDTFMLFLVIVGVLQFTYCVIAGNYPFNAFLSGFAATVGQFVLTASLRIQSNKANQPEFKDVSPER